MQISDALEVMAAELAERRLVVCLCPAPSSAFEGHMVRVAVDRNPAWYRRLCASAEGWRGHRRKADTRVRRQEVERVLAALIDGRVTRSQWVSSIMGEAESLAAGESRERKCGRWS